MLLNAQVVMIPRNESMKIKRQFRRIYVIVITRAEDIIAIISEVTGYNYSTKSTNLNSEFHFYKYLFLLLFS